MTGTRVGAHEGNTITAIVVGLVLGAIVLGVIAAGEEATLALLTIALLLAAAEWFTTLRHAGYQPPALLGFAAVVAMPLAAYWRGSDGIVLVLVFALFGAGLWYVGGVGARPPALQPGGDPVWDCLHRGGRGFRRAASGLARRPGAGVERGDLDCGPRCRRLRRRTGCGPHPVVTGQPEQDG